MKKKKKPMRVSKEELNDESRKVEGYKKWQLAEPKGRGENRRIHAEKDFDGKRSKKDG